jgi:hypothetical protein
LAVGGCTIGANAFCITGASVFNNASTFGGNVVTAGAFIGNGANVTLTIQNNNFSTAGGGGLAVNMATGTFSPTSGLDTAVQIQPTWNQSSGTGSFTALNIAPKFTTAVNGTCLLTNWQAGSSGTTAEASMSCGGVLTDNGEIFTAAAPTVAASQIGFGSTVTANTNCGVVGTGCIVINVAGTTRYITYY